jgi:uncharacterized protein YodC (DUF2158 family)
MEETPFKVGDIVKLKVGGPKMIVDSISDYDGTVRCQWFTGSKLNHGSFAPGTLELVTDSDAKIST